MDLLNFDLNFFIFGVLELDRMQVLVKWILDVKLHSVELKNQIFALIYNLSLLTNLTLVDLEPQISEKEAFLRKWISWLSGSSSNKLWSIRFSLFF